MENKVKFKKYNLTIAKLLEIILSMSEEQQNTVLKQAEELVKGDRRVFERKTCQLSVDFATSDRTHKGTIKNISRHGVFIEAKAPVMIGEEVLMAFKVGRDPKPVKMKGEIAHATRWGLGVVFTVKGPQFDQQIRDLVRRI